MKVKEILSSDFAKIENFMVQSFLNELVPVRLDKNTGCTFVDHRKDRPESENLYAHKRNKKILTMKQWKNLVSELFKNHADTHKKMRDSTFFKK